jgi:hypothetical protein
MSCMTGSHDIAVDIAFDPRAIDELVTEILHYLEVVELFRREQHEPSWRSEDAVPSAVLDHAFLLPR